LPSLYALNPKSSIIGFKCFQHYAHACKANG